MSAVKARQPTDTEILEQFAQPATREPAFRSLMFAYQERLYHHIRKLVVVHEDADDLLQETFIKAYKNLEGFKGNSSLFTWLYRIATNEALGFLRKKKQKYFLPIHDYNAELAGKLEVELSPAADEVECKLQSALLKLPDKQRLVFNLRYYDEMPYEQIAEITGTSVGSLKASYHIAAKKVEEHLISS